MDRTKILLIDDDTVLGSIITTALKDEGYDVHYQSSLIGITTILNKISPSIMILDVEIGTDDGIDIASELKMTAPGIPILYISSHTESSEVVRALQSGAVGYLKKPFDIEELIAYVNRYAHPVCNTTIRIGSFELDLQKRILFQGSKELKNLSKLEFSVLKLLYSHKGEIVLYEKIEELWGDTTMNEHSLYNYIVKLRKLLASDSNISISTIGGSGYMLCIKE
ncbi:MAG: response regulator transcription factor [Bacteroides sp.]|nr:response regulator transcription factor [Bacteroides sp.]